MNDLATLETHNPFLTYAETASRGPSLEGDLLKFSKGEYLAGQNGDEVEAGTEVVALMNDLQVGWVKWEDNRPSEHRMGKVSEGFKPASRGDLGDTDQARWEVDEASGKPRDPWQFTNYLPMRQVDGGRMFTFTTASKGGLNAIGEICKAYGAHMRTAPDQMPIVRLGVDSYKHSNKAYGKIFTPAFEVIGWDGDEAQILPPIKGRGAKAAVEAQTRF